MTTLGQAQAVLETTPIGRARAESIRPLARAAFGSFGLNVVNTAAATLTSIFLAQALGVADYGTYSVVVAAVTLLALPAVLGVDRLLVRDIAILTREEAHGLARGLLVRALQGTLVLSVAIALIAALAAWLLTHGDPQVSLLAFIVGLAALPFVALGRVAQGALMGFHHVVVGQFSDLLLRPVLLLGLVVAALLFFDSALTAPAAVGLFTLSAAIAAVVALAVLLRRTPAAVRGAAPAFRTRLWLGGAFALALLSSAAVINTQTGVVLLGALGTNDEAGLYAVAQRAALLVAFPLAAVNSALAPTAARLWSANDRHSLQRLVTLSTRGVLLASIPVALLFIVFGNQLLSFFFGADFGAADTALAILCVGQICNAATGSVAVLLVMTGRQGRATAAMAAGAATNIIVAALLIPAFGAAGAAVGAAVSLVLSNTMMVLVTRRSLGIDSTAVGRAPRTTEPA